jgi:hypothetical protein
MTDEQFFYFDGKVIHRAGNSKVILENDIDIPMTACGIAVVDLWTTVSEVASFGVKKCKLCFPREEKRASFEAKKVEIIEMPEPAKGVII